MPNGTPKRTANSAAALTFSFRLTESHKQGIAKKRRIAMK
jgi:hypothetical protein